MSSIDRSSVPPPPIQMSKSPKVILIPWDPDSNNHVHRLYKQRVVCGWKYDQVEKWRGLQREGKMALNWVVLSDDEPEKNFLLSKHISQFSDEKFPLVDTGKSFGGRPRTPPVPATLFIPVGHVSVDGHHEDASLVDPSQGLYSITALYISKALQGSGLGRAAMDAIEMLAAGEPLHAKTLSLDAMAKEHYVEDDPIWAIRKMPVPESITHEWYCRRGYVEYSRKVGWYLYDEDGAEYPVTAVCMKKNIVR